MSCTTVSTYLGGAHSAAGARGAVRLLARAALRLEAAHHRGAWSPAGGWCAVALSHDVAGRVELHCVAVRRHDVIRSIAVAAACGVRLQLERRWALVLTALDLAARRLQFRVAEGVLGRVLRVQCLLIGALAQQSGAAHREGAEHECNLHVFYV